MILAPMVRGRKGEHKEVFDDDPQGGLPPRPGRRRGGRRRRAARAGARRKPHNIEAVIDRVVIREGVRDRLAESINLAVQHGDGLVLATLRREDRPAAASGTTGCSARSTPARTARSATRNWSRGRSASTVPTARVRRAKGWASRVAFDPELVLPDCEPVAGRGAIAPWKGDDAGALRKHQSAAASRFSTRPGIRWNTPLEKLAPKHREQLLHGDGKQFPGVLAMLEKEYATTTSEPKRQRLEAFRGEVVCAECGGARLRPEARAVRVGRQGDSRDHGADGRRRPGVLRAARVRRRRRSRSPEPILGEIASRLEFLDRVGLDYLTLDRPADTLSGGELQRVRLATGLGSGLVGVCYVLDEPSIGLHPRDNQRLIDALRDLQARGNTVVVVEHDETIMRQADWLIDLGPGAGRHGGRIVAQGTPDEVGRRSRLAHRPLSCRASADSRARPAPPRGQDRGRSRIEGVTTNNLKNVDRAVSALGAGLRHRRERLGQEFAVERDAGPGAGPPAGRHRPQARPAHEPARREPDRQGGADRPVAHRPHAAEQSGHVHRRVRRDSQGVRQHPRRPAARLQGRAGSASTSRAAAAKSARARGSRRSR